jgi:endonuclease YncB( thermonuclease family)
VSALRLPRRRTAPRGLTVVSAFTLDFTSRCTPNGVHDGDTFYVDFLDLGVGHRQYPLGNDKHIAVRLAGSNAIELPDPGGVESRDALAALLGTGYVWLRTVKPDEFKNRIDAYPFLPDGTDVVATQISRGWLAPWNGRGTKPVPAWPRLAA